MIVQGCFELRGGALVLVRFPRSPLRCFESAHKAKRVSSAFNVQIWKVAIAKPLIVKRTLLVVLAELP